MIFVKVGNEMKKLSLPHMDDNELWENFLSMVRENMYLELRDEYYITSSFSHKWIHLMEKSRGFDTIFPMLWMNREIYMKPLRKIKQISNDTHIYQVYISFHPFTICPLYSYARVSINSIDEDNVYIYDMESFVEDEWIAEMLKNLVPEKFINYVDEEDL